MQKRVSKPALNPEDREALLLPQSLSEAVYEAVLTKLLELEIKPEERISVDGLCRALGVSQTPLRQALTRLEAQGLVTKTHLVGYRAAPELTRAQFEQLYEARMQLEPFVAAKAAATMEQQELDRLDEMLQQLLSEDGANKPAVAPVAHADTAFHHAIAVASGNLVIANILQALQAQVQFTLMRRSAGLVDVKPATIEHRQILEALRKRDSDAAAHFMREHLSASRKRYWPA